jgi:hypothetical protein
LPIERRPHTGLFTEVPSNKDAAHRSGGGFRTCEKSGSVWLLPTNFSCGVAYMNKPFFTHAEMPEAIGPARSEQPFSAVRLPVGLTAEIDAWANHHEISRAGAIRQLVELGLKAKKA